MDPGSIPESGRSPREGNDNPLQYSGKFHGWRNLVGYNPWGRKESDTTERLHFHVHIYAKPTDLKGDRLDKWSVWPPVYRFRPTAPVQVEA